MKLRQDAITQADLESWLDSTSDFEFEIRTLKKLTDRGLHALHGGSYVDPITKKKRQFDLRCQIRPSLDFKQGLFEYRLAIECKNIGDNFPLIVQCIPRASSESWHDVIATSDKGIHQIPMWHRQSCYQRDNPTGKSLSQVGFDTAKQKEFVATDSDVFEKWSQALSSARGLAQSMPPNLGKQPTFTMVMAVVVVPDGRLWAVSYDESGNRSQGPKAVDSVPYFVSEETAWSHEGRDVVFNISHLEFVTETGLSKLVDRLRSERAVELYFNEDMINRYCEDLLAGRLATPTTR